MISGEGVVSPGHELGITYYQTAIDNFATTYNVYQAADFQTFLVRPR